MDLIEILAYLFFIYTMYLSFERAILFYCDTMVI